jgi:hypothetical protein
MQQFAKCILTSANWAKLFFLKDGGLLKRLRHE